MSSEDGPEFRGKTFTIQSADGLKVKVDFYEIADTNAPIILLFHQAGYSRGEYRQIAPRLNELGFTCMAIDQRSGDKINGVQNETVLLAQQQGLKTGYTDALPDLRASVDYMLENYPHRKIIIWGSSYSSSLVFIIGNEYKKNISGVISFSPGEYFAYNGQAVKYYASKIECPVFITSAGNELESWDLIYKAIPSTEKSAFRPDFQGQHGSKALWKENKGSDAYWSGLTKFLSSFKE